MPEFDDITRLKQYVEGDESAFAVLVERYVHLVYSTALRQVGNPSQAEEITQAVFIILAQKAKSLGPRTILSGWLYQAARLAAANFLRSEIRRQKREQEAYMESLLNEPTPNLWQQIAPLLDDAMGHLSENDRNVVVLRFFQNQSAAEIGDALGIDSATAQKRITRAVGRLREFFAKRSVAHSMELITGAISANSIQAAPVALAKSVTALAIAKGAAAGGSTLTLVKGALKITAWTKAKMAIVTGTGVLLVAGTMTVKVVEIQEHRTYPWQVVTANSDEGLKALNTTPPQVTIVRSKFTTDGHGGLIDDIPPKDQWRYIGIHFTPSNIIERAYSEGFPLLPSQIILPSNMPGGFYDYIANLTNDSQQSLQALIKKKFGLVGKYEMRDMDVLLLKVEHPNAPGLKLGTPQVQSGLVTRGLVHEKNISISRLAKDLGWDLQIPVIDQTGLVGNYDFDFPENLGATSAEKLEKAKQWLLTELGLKLVPNREPIEMLVVEKVK
jgi:uncharacterized protein (TIGR03435 family)